MTQIDIAPEDILKQSIEENNITTEELVKRYGKPVRVDLHSATTAVHKGWGDHLFCTICDEMNPTGADFGESGLHIVNVMERYYFPKPLPENLYVDEINYSCLEDN